MLTLANARLKQAQFYLLAISETDVNSTAQLYKSIYHTKV